MSVEILGENLVEITIEPPPIIEIEVEPSPVVEIEVLPGGVSYGGVISLEYQLVLGRLIGQPSLHKVLTYTDGNLTSIDVYNNDTLTTQLLDIQFSYTSGNLTQKVLTDLVNGKILTVDYDYTGNNLTSITETFS